MIFYFWYGLGCAWW